MFTLVGVDKVIRESKKCNPHEANRVPILESFKR